METQKGGGVMEWVWNGWVKGGGSGVNTCWEKGIWRGRENLSEGEGI